MALNLIKRKLVRKTPSFTRGKAEQNDLLFAVRKAGDKSREQWELSDAKFEELGLASHSIGAAIVEDDVTKKVYLAVLPSEMSEFLKGREGKNKGQEFLSLEAIEMFVEKGVIASERQNPYFVGFNLVADPAKLSELPEGSKGIYEIVPTELVGNAKRAVSGSDSEDSQEEVASTVSTTEQATGQPQTDVPSVNPQEEVATTASDDDGWDS